MITISLFALLALSLLLLVWILCLLKHSRDQEEFINILLERVNLQEAGIRNISKDTLGLQEELERVSKSRIRAQEDLAHYKLILATEAQKANELRDLADNLQAQLGQVEPELRHQFLIEDVLKAEVADLKKQLFNTKEETSMLLESYQEELDVAQDCIWDKEKQLSDKQEILNEVAAELFSLGFRDGIIKDVEVLRIRDLALEQNIPF